MKATFLMQDGAFPHDGTSLSELKAFVQFCLRDLQKRTKRIIPPVGITFVSKEKIQRLNKRYRGYDEPTDVLSFDAEEEGYLGDILISQKVVAEYAYQHKISVDEELRRDILHGMMHLLGFTHEQHLQAHTTEKMFIVQEEILARYQKKE